MPTFPWEQIDVKTDRKSNLQEIVFTARWWATLRQRQLRKAFKAGGETATGNRDEASQG